MEENYKRDLLNSIQNEAMRQKAKQAACQSEFANPQASVRSGLTGVFDKGAYDIMASLVFRKAIHAEYVALGFTPTKAMDDEIATLTRQAKAAYRQELEARLAAAKKKADELKSKEKLREEAEKEIADLTAALEGR